MGRNTLKDEGIVREKLTEAWAKSLEDTENGVTNGAEDWDKEGIREYLLGI